MFSGAQHLTTHSKVVLPNVFQGAVTLSANTFRGVMINGQATLGQEGKTTDFQEVLVVNGDLKSESTGFDTVEVNGNAIVKDCQIREKAEVFGTGFFSNCMIGSLDLRGGKFTLVDSHVTGDVAIKRIFGGQRPKIYLKGTVVEGRVVFTDSDGNPIQGDIINLR